MAKEYAQPFYNSKRWQRTRDAYRAHVGGLCEDCLAKGIITAGREVHHIIPLTPDNINDINITCGYDNLRLLCRNCHLLRHQIMGAGKVGRHRAEIKPKSWRYSIDPVTGKILPTAPPGQ